MNLDDLDHIKIEQSWKTLLADEFRQDYFNDIRQALRTSYAEGKTIYPPSHLIFNAFDTTAVDKVKIVILGQDPYHNPDEAMGLSFSVPKEKRVPPSLKNIYKELDSDIGMDIPNHGDLTSWAEQGILLLNAMLTVEHKKAGSHKNIGWQHFTNAVISRLSESKTGIIFMLWGRFAQNKKDLIDKSKHHILEAAHPSPLARGAYFGSKHFSKANALLDQMNQSTINWNSINE